MWRTSLLLVAASADDELTLLQTRIHRRNPQDLQLVLQEIQHAKNPVEASLIVEKFAQSTLKSGETIDDATKAALRTIKTTLVDTTQQTITDTTLRNENLLKQHAFAMGTCGAEYTTQSMDDATLLADVRFKEAEHAQCRALLQQLDAEKERACQELEDFNAGLRPPSCMVPDGNDGMQSHFSSLESYVNTNFPRWTELNEQCTAAGDARVAKDSECDSMQGQYESYFCGWRTMVHTSCADFSSCYDMGLREFVATKDMVLESQVEMKLEWTAVEKIKCYIDVLVTEQTLAERQAAMTACKENIPDVSHLTIAVPTVPPHNVCNLDGATVSFPCNEAWDSSMQGMMDLAQCIPCPQLPPHLLHTVELAGGASQEHIWTGSSNPQWPLDMREESSAVTHLQLVPENDIATLQSCLQDVSVDTDLVFKVQRDDSAHGSFIKYIRKDTGAFETFSFLGGYSDHTSLEFDGKTLTCPSASASAQCNSLPAGGAVEVILVEVMLQPREMASAHADQWHRNKYTVEGSKYNVEVPPSCKVAPGPCSSVAEVSEYTLVEAFDIPDPSANWDEVGKVPFTHTETMPQEITRVGYCVKMGEHFVWTSFEHSDTSQVGLPVDYHMDLRVYDLNVESNNPGVKAATGADGVVGFWSYCADPGAAASPTYTKDCYGSMQVWDSGKETIWAFNGWRSAGNCDLQMGSGTKSVGNADGTFHNNCNEYLNGKAQVLTYVKSASPSLGPVLDEDS